MNDVKYTDDNQEQQQEESQMDIETKIEIMPEEFGMDVSGYSSNTLLDEICIKVENGAGCEEFLYNYQENKNDIFAIDSSGYNGNTFLPLDDSCIKVENVSECEEFLYNHQEVKINLYEAITNDEATTSTEEDGIKVVSCHSPNHNETGVNEVRKPCPVCHKKFPNSFFVRRHSVVHSITRKYECDICKYRFTTKGRLKRHKEKHYRAPANNGVFLNYTNLNKQMSTRAHSGIKNFTCVYCEKAFDTNNNLNEHVNTHTDERPHRCKQCGKGFKDCNCLYQDQLRHSKEKLYHCQECSRKFFCPSHLKNHMSIHRKPDPHICDACGSRFARSYGLSIHKQKRSCDRSHKCVECNISFASSESLRGHMGRHKKKNKEKHMSSHTPNNPCHLEKHSGIKNFTCIYCEKAFDTNYNLKEHLNTHTGEKPHLCPKCGKGFKDCNCLYQHQLRHSKEKRYQCQDCSSKFFCPSDLKKHMFIHRTTKPIQIYTCDICDKRFVSSYGLMRHKQKRSCNRSHKCVECNISFASSESLRGHMGRHRIKNKYIAQKLLNK